MFAVTYAAAAPWGAKNMHIIIKSYGKFIKVSLFSLPRRERWIKLLP